MTCTIITGGGTGIGAATARLLAGRGHDVVVAGRRRDKLEEVVAEIAAAGGVAKALSADLGDPADVTRIVDFAERHFGRIDHLVNNAAIIKVAPLAMLTLKDIDSHLAINLRAPLLLIREALPHLIESRGSVVNISSSSAALERRGQSLYAATKSALEYLTRALAGELAGAGVRVNAVAPGPVDTPIHATWASDLDAAYAKLVDDIPLGRMGQPDDVARCIAYLVSEDADWVTGAVVPVDGGQTLDL